MEEIKQRNREIERERDRQLERKRERKKIESFHKTTQIFVHGKGAALNEELDKLIILGGFFLIL